MEILGHDQILNYLNNCVKSDRIANAYIFSGPANIGKKMTATWLADVLCKGNKNNITVVNEDGKVNIDQVRGLIEKYSLSSFDGEKKVIIIDNAESISENCYNALLKNIEESGLKTIYILVSSNYYQVIDTIRSRCQRVNFIQPCIDIIRQNINHHDLEKIIEISSGKIGHVIQCVNDEDYAEKLEKNHISSQKILEGKLYEKILVDSDDFDIDSYEYLFNKKIKMDFKAVTEQYERLKKCLIKEKFSANKNLKDYLYL